MPATSARSDQVGGDTRQAAALPPAPSVFRKLSPALRESIDRLLTHPIDFMNHESFRKPATAKKLYTDDPFFASLSQPWCNSTESTKPISSTAPGNSRTLSREEECRLFLQFNYARYRVAKLLAKFAGRRLTVKAAKELLLWDERTRAVRACIIQANMPLVLAMAKRTRLGNIDYADLISEGNMALLRSADKFDCSRGFKFSTYACRAILKSFSRVAMRTSRYRGRFPTEFDPSLEKSNHTEHLREEHEADCVEELRGIIQENAADLNEVEVKVIRARFALGSVEGLDSDGPKTLEQVGMVIGVTKERVRQIQNRALCKLRVKLQDDFLAA